VVSDESEQQSPPASQPPRLAHSKYRLLTVLVIVGAIIGAAYVIGERDNFDTIGQGGVNAKLIPAAGEVAPELITFDTRGNIVRLSDFYGQPVWLNFWGSWCPPCRAEFPDIQAAWEDLNDEGLVMLGVAVGEDPLVAQDYANRVGGTFPVLADPAYLAAIIPDDQPEALAAAQEMATSYTINNYPTHIFINRDGTVDAVVLSPMDFEDAMGYGQAIIGSPMPELPATPLPNTIPATPPKE
jgi:thiol-disulfide isomerase/thioredoxin